MLKKMFNAFMLCFLGSIGVCLGMVASNRISEKFSNNKQEFNENNSTEEE